MEYKRRVTIRFLCKERVSPKDIHACFEAQFGDATHSKQSIRRCQYVRQEREDLYREVRSGRPPIDFLDIQILELLEEQLFHLVYSIVEAQVSSSTSLRHLRESLGMKVLIYVGSRTS
jgi:hypothetical protein